ncbi:phosphoribosyltransferase [Acetobacterium carbinolicum]|jgi:predicted phosphoribosyltransferase|uniref:phosphoribosyltransferase n=1 Tax=Acetobacterium TaxID=33951 RepID=UPI000DBEC092|nr:MULTISPECIES: phosphoribosyltransferase family protein [unclassified Acetobacterium]AWW28118.1 phosphoribosyl transferase [Acetobacterium sp. KB-1]MDZ5726837.1 phosphoribosyltransferase family protein [Acetobacterium sp. K1/6]
MLFKNRKDAGIKLANALEKYKREDVIVLALPRGGVILGVEIAKMLDAPLDILSTKKIGHPLNSEYAICAITEDGDPICNSAEVKNIDPEWLAGEIKKVRNEIKRRREIFLGGRALYSVEGKIVIIADDGIATGLTMIAAIDEIKKRNPKRLVIAIPVTPYDTAQKLNSMVDELVSLDIDANYRGAVGAYYEDFTQVEDSEVISILNAFENKDESA